MKIDYFNHIADLTEWLKFNAKLQQKKNNLRLLLKEKGILKKTGFNKFDSYTYFTEAQYKELFTDLLSQAKLELSFTEVAYNLFDGTEKQANGRMSKIQFKLTDIDTGFYETSVITGEAIDKGDKAGYKAYTGALKYYLATTFMVATGDEVETDSPDMKIKPVSKKVAPINKEIKETAPINKETITEKKATEKQKQYIQSFYKEKIIDVLKELKLESLDDLTVIQASDLISKARG